MKSRVAWVCVIVVAAGLLSMGIWACGGDDICLECPDEDSATQSADGASEVDGDTGQERGDTSSVETGLPRSRTR